VVGGISVVVGLTMTIRGLIGRLLSYQDQKRKTTT
jgi:hypothetical protein